MNFLYPGFLFALLTVAIPVIIHLFNFRKFKKIYFSNVQLLKEVEQQQSSKEKLKNLLILASRILAIVFLVLAFAQPYLPVDHQKNTQVNNIASIYIDNSFSMEAVNKDGNLLDEAKRRAKELVKGFGINDKFQLLTNDFEGRHQRLVNQEEFLKALDEVKISASSRDLQQIINRQENILSGAANPYAFLISDFQKNIFKGKTLQSKPEVQYSFLKLNASPLPNIAVDSVWALSPGHQPETQEKFVVQLRNYSEESAVNVPVRLSINNQQKGLSSINIGAGQVQRDTLNFSGLKPGWQKGLISIKDFPVVFDDTLSFSFHVDQNLPVLSINGSSAGPFLKALYGADPYYRLTENPESNVDYNNFSRYRLIILNGLKNPSSGLAQQLKGYLQNGGSLVIFPNLDGDQQAFNSFLTTLSLPAIQKVNAEMTKVDRIDLQHPVFKTVFEQVPKNLDLPTVNRYLTFAESSSSNKENIMTLPGGKLFFARYGIGNGQVYLSASGLNASDGNLARHPVFVPLMYRIASSSGKEENLYYNLATDAALSMQSVQLGKNQSLKLIAPGFEVIPEMRRAGGKTSIYIADQVKRAGFYDLKLADSLLAVYAFNSGRSESDMHYLSKSELESLAGKNNFKVFDADQDALKMVSGINKIGHTFWKLCLILSLLFLAAEILLIRFFNKTKKTI